MLLPRSATSGRIGGAAEICGVDPKTVKRKVLAREAGEFEEGRASRAPVPRNTDVARSLVAQRVDATKAKITAKRLLVEARAVGYVGSARNFRRLVAAEKKKWRTANGRQGDPGFVAPSRSVANVAAELLAGSGRLARRAVTNWGK